MRLQPFTMPLIQNPYSLPAEHLRFFIKRNNRLGEHTLIHRWETYILPAYPHTVFKKNNFSGSGLKNMDHPPFDSIKMEIFVMDIITNWTIKAKQLGLINSPTESHSTRHSCLE